MWEQLIAIDQIEERHRLPAQRVDDVMVVDHMAMLLALGRVDKLNPTADASEEHEGHETLDEFVVAGCDPA